MRAHNDGAVIGRRTLLIRLGAVAGGAWIAAQTAAPAHGAPASAPARGELIDSACAAWVAGDRAGAQRSVDALDRPTAERLSRMLRDVATACAFPLSDTVPVGADPHAAVVILGFGLLPDGSMRPTLRDRCDTGADAAWAYPAAPVIVTGGNPRGGVTEAEAMARYLASRGVDPARIAQDRTAASTVGNATACAALCRSRGIGSAILVTSSVHTRRAVADFLVAGLPLAAVIASDPAAHAAPDAAYRAAMVADARAVAGL